MLSKTGLFSGLVRTERTNDLVSFCRFSISFWSSWFFLRSSAVFMVMSRRPECLSASAVLRNLFLRDSYDSLAFPEEDEDDPAEDPPSSRDLLTISSSSSVSVVPA